MPNFEMQERKEPEFIQFAEGEYVEGVLVRIDKVEVGDPKKPDAPKKPTARFTLKDAETGALQAFLGTYDIVTKLSRADIGYMVRVRYEGPDKSVQRNGNPLKRFKVEVSNIPVGDAKPDVVAGTEITDEDIPF